MGVLRFIRDAQGAIERLKVRPQFSVLAFMLPALNPHSESADRPLSL
jgi:hypothetical protein